MPHSFSLAVSMNLEHSIKEESHERYPVHLQCLGNIKKKKNPDFQAMTVTKVKQRGSTSLQIEILCNASVKMAAPPRVAITITLQNKLKPNTIVVCSAHNF